MASPLSCQLLPGCKLPLITASWATSSVLPGRVRCTNRSPAPHPSYLVEYAAPTAALLLICPTWPSTLHQPRPCTSLTGLTSEGSGPLICKIQCIHQLGLQFSVEDHAYTYVQYYFQYYFTLISGDLHPIVWKLPCNCSFRCSVLMTLHSCR